MRLIALLLLLLNLAFFYGWDYTQPPLAPPSAPQAEQPAGVPRLLLLAEAPPSVPVPPLAEAPVPASVPVPAPPVLAETPLPAPEPQEIPEVAATPPAQPGGLQQFIEGAGSLSAGLAESLRHLATVGSAGIPAAPPSLAETPSLQAAQAVSTNRPEAIPVEAPAAEAGPLPEKAEAEATPGSDAGVLVAASLPAEPVEPPEAEAPAKETEAAPPPGLDAEELAAEQAPAETPKTAGTATAKPAKAKSAPAQRPAPKTLCFRIGPYADKKSAEKLAARLAGESITSQIREVYSQAGDGLTWVYLPPLASREAAKAEVRRLTQLGVRDHYLVTVPPLNNAISLGAYRDENSVARRLAELRAKGYYNVKVQPRYQSQLVYWVETGLLAERKPLLSRLSAGERMAEAACEEIAIGKDSP